MGIQTNDRKVFIALPIYGGVDCQFFASCMSLKLEAEMNHNISVKLRMGDSAVGRARNGLTREFLESDCDDLLFIDSDLVFSMEQINRILSHSEDVVGGCYCKKQEGSPQLVCNTMPGVLSPREDGLMNVRYVGTGFMKVSRRAFELQIQHFGNEMRYGLDHDKGVTEYDFWHMGAYEFPDKSRRYLSEDWWFCQKWMDIGGQVWMDMNVLLAHSGSAVYPLSYQKEVLFGRCGSANGAGEGASVESIPTLIPTPASLL